MELQISPGKLLLLVLTVCAWMPGLWTEIVMPQTSMDVMKGQRAVLSATLTTSVSDPSTNTILWSFISDSIKLIISYTNGSVIIGSTQFEDRVGFTDSNPMNNISLYINNTQESDSGRYLCQVIFADRPSLTAELSLDVKV